MFDIFVLLTITKGSAFISNFQAQYYIFIFSFTSVLDIVITFILLYYP